MAPQIKKVALLGATGNVGVPTLKALLETGKFNVTVLVRPGATHKFPDKVFQVKEIDLSSFDSVVAALRGQDAVINATLIPDPLPALYRLIPADFGSDPERVSNAEEFPVFRNKIATLAHLREAVKQPDNRLTYTVVSNGAFLDWNLAHGFLGVDPKNRKAQIIDGGDVANYYTTLDTIGLAVARVLLDPDRTVDRVVYVKSVFKTQKELLGLAQEALGSDGWDIVAENGREKYDWAVGETKKGNFALPVVMHLIRRIVWDAELAKPPENGFDNELLGLKTMSDDEVKDMIRTLVATT